MTYKEAIAAGVLKDLSPPPHKVGKWYRWRWIRMKFRYNQLKRKLWWLRYNYVWKDA